MIVVSRAVVLTPVCDISVTIGKRNVPARILYYGLVVILTVDPGLLPPLLPIPSFSDKDYKIGDEIKFYALSHQHQLVQRSTAISMISSIPSNPNTPIPTWRIISTEAYNIRDAPHGVGGVLCDSSDDSIFAFWMEVKYGNSEYYVGLSYQFYLRPIIDALKNDSEVPSWYCGCVFDQCHLAKAIDLGMPEYRAAQINEIAKSIGTGAHAVFVEEKLTQSICDLQIGDFILEIEDEPVGRMADIRFFSQSESTRAFVLRSGKEIEIEVRSSHLPFTGPPKLVCWGGTILQQTPIFALEQTTPEFIQAAKKGGVTDLESMIYIGACFNGSPADGVLSSAIWILEIDDQKVNWLENLLGIIDKLKGRDNDEYIRVKLIGMQGITSIVGIRLNSHFWPSWILEWNGRKWARTELD